MSKKMDRCSFCGRTERDNYLSSEEAVNYGLIDSVFRR